MINIIRERFLKPIIPVACGLFALGVGLLLTELSLADSTLSDARPSWWGNEIGKAEIVLPGFDPLNVESHTVKLGADRQYIWDASPLPSQIMIKGKPFVSKQAIVLAVNGKTYELTSNDIRITEYQGHHVDVNVIGSVGSLLDFQVNTRVEYDGVSTTELILKPKKALRVDSLYYTANMLDSEWTNVLGFNHDALGNRKKNVVIKPAYQGELLSSVAVVDGERSFWWFIDEAKGWTHKKTDQVTKIHRVGQDIVLQQTLIDSDTILSVAPQHFRFNFLATPVKDAIGNVRSNRVARGKSAEEGKYHGQSLWWIDAFSHQVLPYVDFSHTYPKKIAAYDQSVYPGLAKNKRVQADFKRSGILRLPYFSAHVLNHHDPAYQQYQKLWEVRPRIVWNTLKYDNPFRAMRNDAFLTHRAEGYTDYLLYRFDELIDSLGMEGLYFDQGGVRLSKNMQNGGWLDDAGKLHGASDILALRDFHKRLATLFYLKGKEGLIVSHNSNTMITPAYTFATAMVQGEEFNHWLTDYDYIDSVGIDEVRSRLGARAMGVPTVWLEVLFASSKRLKRSNRPIGMSDKNTWHNSVYYEDAYLNFMTLALLHDMPTWSYAPIPLRNRIMKEIDWLAPERAEFFGYWLSARKHFDDGLFYSYYLNREKGKALFVLSNLTDKAKIKPVHQFIELMSQRHDLSCQIKGQKNHSKNKLLSVDAKRFSLVALNCSKARHVN